MKYLIFVAVCVALSRATWSFGGCPDLGVVDDSFNVTKMRGLWFEFATEKGHFVKTQAEVSSLSFMSETNATSGHTNLEVLTSFVDEDRNYILSSKDQLSCTTEVGEGCTFSKQGHWFPYNWLAVDTDHFGYAILQECKSIFGLFHNDKIRIITR